MHRTGKGPSFRLHVLSALLIFNVDNGWFGLALTSSVWCSQVLAGSYSFFIFKQQTTSFYFQVCVREGGKCGSGWMTADLQTCLLI